jgi:hypothetical protein
MIALVRLNEIRENETAVELPLTSDAGLFFIGKIHTPWTSRLECPRQGRPDGPVCRIEIGERWRNALDGIDDFERIEVLYGSMSRGGISCVKVRQMTAPPAALSRCALLYGQIQSVQLLPRWFRGMA